MPRISSKGLGRSDSSVYRFRVPNDLLDAWEKFVVEHDEEGPEVLRRVMAQLVNKPRPAKPKASTDFPEPPAMKTTSEVDRAPKKAVKLLLTQDEHAALAKIAEDRECSIQFWILSLVRAALTRGITVGGAELQALGDSNYQLIAIGRNLNQIAHHINADPSRNIHLVTSALIETLNRKFEDHKKQVHALVKACSHRWKVMPAESGGTRD